MITIIDYKLGNLGSVQNMLNYLGYDSVITSDIKQIEVADKLIIAGVGSFDSGMENLAELGLIDVLNEKVVNQKKPILGICLGLQLMTNSSQEGQMKGLGWIDAQTIKFSTESLRVPHMTWNLVAINNNAKLFQNAVLEPKFYFVHSYYLAYKNQSFVAGLTNYGIDFISAVEQDNVFGVQFHPEKSHKHGMNVLKNFAQL